MPYTLLQLNKIYKGNAPLINSMVRPDSEDFRTLACYLSGSNDGRNGMEGRAAQTIYCDFPKKQVKWTRRKVLRRVAAIIDEHEVDLVVCQFRRSIPIGVLAARLSTRKPKVVGVLHGIVGGKVGFGRKLLNFFVFRGLDRLVSVSRSGIGDILRLNIGLDPKKVTAVPNGLEFDAFTAPAQAGQSEVFPQAGSEDFVFLMVGRLAPVKNHRRVLRAFSTLIRDFPRARLAIAGQGPLQSDLESLIAELELGDRVHLLGYRRDVPELLKNADAYLLPSLREGLPLALAEAMAAACPVITSRVGGMLELVPAEDYGYLVDPESEASIARAMASVLQNHPDKNRELAAKARQRALEEFNAERMARDYENLYRELLTAPT